MKISLIVSFYKNLENLELIFQALAMQSEKDFEVIIAEDDCSENTIWFLENKRKEYSFEIKHVSQEKDEGFRKNEMLNRAIRISKSEALVFIDGDCIPHRHFIKAYAKSIEKGKILFGKRVNLGPKFSKKLLQDKSIDKLSIINILTSDSNKKKEGIYFPFLRLKFKDTGLLGCNWGILKQHLLEINGFDEDYISAGVGEDVDVEWRLTSIGLNMVSMKNKANVYHIYHPKGYSDDTVQANYKILDSKKKAGFFKCLNGIEKL